MLFRSQRWGQSTAQHAGRSMAGYWTEEDPLIAGASELAEFHHAVDIVRDDVARLEKRIDALLNRRGAKPAKKTGY